MENTFFNLNLSARANPSPKYNCIGPNVNKSSSLVVYNNTF